MEKRHFFWILLLYFCGGGSLQAQWDDLHTQYWAIRSYINPSFTGETEAVSATALYRYSWSGIENAPRQFYLTANMPFEFLGKRHGVGLVVHNESVGALHNSFLAIQYSLKKEIGDNFLSLGLQAGIYNLNFDAGNKHITEDPIQPGRSILKVNPTDKQPIDLSTGISWTGRSFFAGLSAMHLNQPRFYPHTDSLTTDLKNDSARSVIPRSYNLIAGYNIRPFYPFAIQPMVWIWTDFNTTQVQATLRMEYNRKFSGGLSWRKDDGYLLFAGVLIKEVELGYAYGIHTSGPAQNSNGSHELFLRYQFPLDYFKPKRQPHQSIRLL